MQKTAYAQETLWMLADQVEAACRRRQDAVDLGERIASELRLIADVPAVAGLPLETKDCLRAFMRLQPERPADARDPSIRARRIVCQMLCAIAYHETRGQVSHGSALRLSAVYRAAVDHLEEARRDDLQPFLNVLNREIVEIEVADPAPPPSAPLR